MPLLQYDPKIIELASLASRPTTPAPQLAPDIREVCVCLRTGWGRELISNISEASLAAGIVSRGEKIVAQEEVWT